MKKFLLALLILSGIPLCAQTVTTYTGTIKDLTGATVTSGRITWTLNAPSGGVIPGTGSFIASTVSCLINASGAPVSSSDGVSACTVVNNTALTPTGTSYTLCIQPYNVTPGSCFTTFATGGTANISNLVPTPATQPNYGVASTQVANTWASPQTFSQGFTVASGFAPATLASLFGISSAPTATQTIAQPAGTTLNLNNLNSVQAPEMLNTAHSPLAFWDYVLHSCRANVVTNIQVHGDSRTIADTATSPGAGTGTNLAVTFGNKWVDQLRTTLNSFCNGSHGSGVIPFRWGTGVFATLGFNQDYYTTTGTYTATDVALGPYQPNTSDAMLVTATTNGATVTFAPGQNFDHLIGYCVSGPGLNAWTLKIDGGSVGSCGGTGGSEAAVRVVSSAVTLGPHTAQAVCATQPCEAYGLEVQSGARGVEVHNLSVASASAEVFGLAPSTQYAFSDLISGGIALDIIYEISNEPGQGYSTTQFQTTLNNMLAHDAALPNLRGPSVLIVSPLQDGITGQGPYYPILAATAAANNTAFVDLRDRWGQALAPSWLFGPDGFHENNAGHGEVAASISQTLIDYPNTGRGFHLSDPVTTDAGVDFDEPGLNNFGLHGWGTGNGNGLPGVLGVFDSSDGIFPFAINNTDDLYGAVPVSGGNVAAGAGATWSILHSGAIGGLSFTATGLPAGCAQLPCVVAQPVPFSALSANLSATNVIASAPAGRYRLTCEVLETRAATTSSTLPSCTFFWTDATTGFATGANQMTPASSLTGNTVGIMITNVAYVNAQASSPIQVLTVNYASSGATTMQFQVIAVVERMQ